jgi:hypothetical protein
MNAALAMIEAAAPRDEIEGALAIQMACTHTAAMAVLAKLDIPFTSERRVVAFGSAAARLMRAYATQVEVLRRLRNGGQQFVRVEQPDSARSLPHAAGRGVARKTRHVLAGATLLDELSSTRF